MFKRLTLLLTLLATPALALDQPTDFSKAHWDEKSERDDIKLFRWDVPKSSVPAFRAEGVVEASLMVLASVLLQTERRKEWVPFVEEARVLRRYSKTDWVEYWHLGLPIIKDR